MIGMPAVDVSEEKKAQFVENEKKLTSSVPEYNQFATGELEYRDCRIIGTNQSVPMLFETKRAQLGDFFETYVNLLIEEKMSKSFFGRLVIGLQKFFGIRNWKRDFDRDYALRKMKNAIQGRYIEW